MKMLTEGPAPWTLAARWPRLDLDAEFLVCTLWAVERKLRRLDNAAARYGSTAYSSVIGATRLAESPTASAAPTQLRHA
jgi:hypothetical protein